MLKRKLRGGMVGGGLGAFIGPVHRMAATMDGKAEFVAGAFSSNPAKSKKSGAVLYLDPSRVYGDYERMAKAEQRLPESDRLDFVSIVTPNASHLKIAKTFLEAGFNVICDKPMTLTLQEAHELQKVVAKSKKVFAVTHNYTGYPMVKQARNMVKQGALGKINKIVVEYPQGWLSGLLTSPKSSIGIWRMDPASAGGSCCIGDIGTHAENLVRYITGLQIVELCADISSFIPGNKLEDDGNVLVHYDNGARGILYASQISTGEENGLRVRIYGTKLGLEWRQEDPNYLTIKDPRGFRQILSRGNAMLCREARDASRLPCGHPDGFIEAFANIYLEAYKAIEAQVSGKKIPEADFPTVHDGVTGMAFIETVLESAQSKQKWTRMKK